LSSGGGQLEWAKTWGQAMSRTILPAALAAAAALAGAAHADSCSLNGLGWMQGAWRDDHDTVQSEERWIAGPGGRLMESAWVLRTDTPGGFLEAGTIRDEAGVITFRLRHFSSDLATAREEKDAPLVFTAARCDAASVVFDGQGPHAGEHITYRRAGDAMTFIGDFIHDGQPVRAEVDYKLGR
jgi:hypothetical protein